MAAIQRYLEDFPSHERSISDVYEKWLQAQKPVRPTARSQGAAPRSQRIAIIGAGMAGLYAGLLLRSRGHEVVVFEASPIRVGGRIYTVRFSEDRNQYFEAGAMRIPKIPEQKLLFDLIAYVNKHCGPAERVQLIPYILEYPQGNLVYVNDTREKSGAIMTVEYANKHPAELRFPLDGPDRDRTAPDLLRSALASFGRTSARSAESVFQEFLKYDHYSFRGYLRDIQNWGEDKINYTEVMTSQTNQFHSGFVEIAKEFLDFSSAEWCTIQDGMERLPNACATLVGQENIRMGARVTEISSGSRGRVTIKHTKSPRPEAFHRVLVTVPPAALRTIETPVSWSVRKRHAIRALHFEPLFKIGLRFADRFWEKVDRPSFGGQSLTDLPSRWVVYPSYGLRDEGPGVLLLYSWMTDALAWLPLSDEQRKELALRDLATLYDEHTITSKFIEHRSISWSAEYATGDAMFFPGQFSDLYRIARQAEGGVYFAGEHLSPHHTWILGALKSALDACQQLTGEQLEPLTAQSSRDWR
jgi:monoamine oxidase